MIRKLFCFLLALAMLFSVTVFAESSTDSAPPDGFGNGNPPDGFNGGKPPEGAPPDGFGGGNPPDGTPPDGFGGGNPPGGKTASFEYNASTEVTEAAELTSREFSSDASDESALIVNTSENVTITDPTVMKTGDSGGGDSCSFYGLNAALLVMGGSTATISGGVIESSAAGANGVFSYGGNGGRNGAAGDGTKVIISDTVITTTGDGSGGIMTTGGGITCADNLIITTSGRSSAAIRTDRGGGTVEVDGGTYTTNGLGSPAIYSTADVTVKNAALVSNLSEGIYIEGNTGKLLPDCR